MIFISFSPFLLPPCLPLCPSLPVCPSLAQALGRSPTHEAPTSPSSIWLLPNKQLFPVFPGNKVFSALPWAPWRRGICALPPYSHPSPLNPPFTYFFILNSHLPSSPLTLLLVPIPSLSYFTQSSLPYPIPTSPPPSIPIPYPPVPIPFRPLTSLYQVIHHYDRPVAMTRAKDEEKSSANLQSILICSATSLEIKRKGGKGGRGMEEGR